MKQEIFDVADESGDRKYFTIVPNYILNHSTMWDREVYIQMKRIAGDTGKCWASRGTLAKQCGMSIRRLDQSIKYLLEHEWICRVGTRKIATKDGGMQQVYEYQIVDLWKKNVTFYEKGSAGGALPNTSKVAQEVHQGSAGGAHKEEPVLLRTDIAANAAHAIFSLKEEIEKLYESPRRDLNLIGWYFEKRKPDIRSKEQFASALTRHLRAAKQLAPFTDEQLGKAHRYVSVEYPEWTLETINKKLSK